MKLEMLSPLDIPTESVEPKFHRSRRQVDGIAMSIVTYGWLQPIIVCENLGRLIDGVVRVDLASGPRLGPWKSKNKTIPAMVVSMSERDAVCARIALNLGAQRIAAMQAAGSAMHHLMSTCGLSRTEAISTISTLTGFRQQDGEIIFSPTEELFWPQEKGDDGGDEAADS